MSYDRFFKMIEQVPRIKHLWNSNDFGGYELNIALLDNELNVMSSGEKHITRFFVSVWFGSSDGAYDFNLVESMAYLDLKERQIIIDWMNDPFWP